MLWSRSVPPTVPAAPATVPDAQALRRAALQAAWRRDRRVGRRRVALRWLMWAFWRYGIPMATVLALALAVWLWLLPGIHRSLASTPSAAAATQPVNTPRAAQAPTAPEATARTEGTPSASPDTTTEDVDSGSIRLRLEPGWLDPGRAPRPQLSPPATTESVQDPSLKPENWLHSKEP
jgi:hypothetical protein